MRKNEVSQSNHANQADKNPGRPDTDGAQTTPYAGLSHCSDRHPVTLLAVMALTLVAPIPAPIHAPPTLRFPLRAKRSPAPARFRTRVWRRERDKHSGTWPCGPCTRQTGVWDRSLPSQCTGNPKRLLEASMVDRAFCGRRGVSIQGALEILRAGDFSPRPSRIQFRSAPRPLEF